MRLLMVWLGKIILMVTRLSGHGGSALPGLVVEKIYSKFIAKMARRLKVGSILVTGTNGKTTTTKMIAGILKAAGKKIVHNRAGSNMSRGVASALIEHSGWLGRLRDDVGLFEVDEAWVEDVASKLQPKAVVVLNLARDQLDRYGELDTTAKLIGSGLKYAANVLLNADDPQVAALAQATKGKVTYFGATSHLRVQVPHDEALLSGSRRPSAGSMPRPKPQLLLNQATASGEKQKLEITFENHHHQLIIPLLGVYNGYNAMAALATSSTLGVSLTAAIKSLAKVPPAFGRSEFVHLDGRKLQLLLVKNPSGFNQVIQTFLSHRTRQPVLMAINDNIADGRDVSWLWDVDFEALSPRGHQILASGIRAYDLAVRLKYAQMPSAVEPELDVALNQFIDSLPAKATGYIVPTYTAMLELRRLLAKKTKIGKVWK